MFSLTMAKGKGRPAILVEQVPGREDWSRRVFKKAVLWRFSKTSKNS